MKNAKIDGVNECHQLKKLPRLYNLRFTTHNIL